MAGPRRRQLFCCEITSASHMAARADAVAPLSVASPSAVADATAMAEQLAQEEGLTLIPSSNASGFKGVIKNRRFYTARASEHGADVSLGSFPTAQEAALAYARHLASRPAVPHDRSFGVPNSAAGLGKRQWKADELTTVESVVAVEADDQEEETDAVTPTTVVTVTTEPEHAESSIMSSSGPTFKRRRTARTTTDAYEFTMPPSTRVLTVPVPEGAVRAVCSITFHYA